MSHRLKTIAQWLFVVGLGLVVAHCDNANFGSNGAGKSKAKEKDKIDGDGKDDESDDGGDDLQSDGKDPNETAVGDTSDDGNSDKIFDNGEGQRRETFAFGKDAKPPIVDYLFVIDNSPSMSDHVTLLQSGFAGLTADSFPKKARIAVMNTMPAKADDLSVSFNGDKQEGSMAAANAEPGFLRLVDKSGIAAYQAATKFGAVFKTPGCDKAWFAPEEKDATGARCFDAHTPISLKGGPCEAGLVSFSQLVEKSGSTRVFRKGSLANVVFLSDTHDPGCPGAEGKGVLDGLRPSFEVLKQKVEANSAGLAGFKVHAIAPSKACPKAEGAPVSGPTYNDAATASKGQILDLCTSTDFKGVLEKIVADTKPEKAIFNVSKDVKDIVSVKIDGAKTNDFEVVGGSSVEVKGLDADQAVTVEITYSY